MDEKNEQIHKQQILQYNVRKAAAVDGRPNNIHLIRYFPLLFPSVQPNVHCAAVHVIEAPSAPMMNDGAAGHGTPTNPCLLTIQYRADGKW